jgi:glycosyltransferase involved in cell wall biosynthesis
MIRSTFPAASRTALAGPTAVTPQSTLMISPAPSASVQALLDALPSEAKVRLFHGLDTDAIEALYSLASALLFPSHAEGFGWPIAEALACGCPVITTDEAPMTEVGGPHAHYLPRWSGGTAEMGSWAEHGARLICAVIDRSPEAQTQAARAGIERTARFDAAQAIVQQLVGTAPSVADVEAAVARTLDPAARGA